MALNVKVGSFNVGTGALGTNVVVTGVGFQPKVVFFWWCGATGTVDVAQRGDARRGHGWAVSAASRFCTAGCSVDGAAAGTARQDFLNSCCVALVDNSLAVVGKLDFVSFDADGFTLIVDDVFPASIRVHYFALGGSDVLNVAAGSFSEPTATGNQAITGVGFQPDAVFFIPSHIAGAFDFGSANTQVGLGAMVKNPASVMQGAITVVAADHGADPSEAKSYSINGECIAMYSGGVTSINARAAPVSMDIDGFTVNWLERISTRPVLWLAIRGPKFFLGDGATATTLTTVVESGFGFQPAAVMFISDASAVDLADTPSGTDQWSLGVATSPTERAAMAGFDVNAQATTQVGNAIEHDEVYVNLEGSGGTVEGLMDLQSLDADGFTAVMDDADNAANFFWYVGIGPAEAGGGGGGAAGAVQQRRSQEFSGFGFQGF